MIISYNKEERNDKPTKTYIIEMSVKTNSEEDVEDWLIRQLMEERANVEDMCWNIWEAE